MEKYTFLEHTADAKFQAFGKDLEEAFGNAALALTSIFINPEEVKPAVEEKVSAEGNDEKALLYAFLEEFLFLLDTKGFILSRMEDLQISGKRITGTAIGDYVGNSYQLHGGVKAITYNDMDIRKEEGRYVVQAVVDI